MSKEKPYVVVWVWSEQPGQAFDVAQRIYEMLGWKAADFQHTTGIMIDNAEPPIVFPPPVPLPIPSPTPLPGKIILVSTGSYRIRTAPVIDPSTETGFFIQVGDVVEQLEVSPGGDGKGWVRHGGVKMGTGFQDKPAGWSSSAAFKLV